MKSKIEIFTSYIEESNIERIKSMNLLPIFVIRSMGRLEFIEKWAGTPLHFRELAPSKELFREYRAGNIDQTNLVLEININKFNLFAHSSINMILVENTMKGL